MELPERLLGVCESCKHWYLIDLVPDVSQGVMVMLPDNEVIRELSRPNPSDGISVMSRESDEGSPAIAASDRRAGILAVTAPARTDPAVESPAGWPTRPSGLDGCARKPRWGPTGKDARPTVRERITDRGPGIPARRRDGVIKGGCRPRGRHRWLEIERCGRTGYPEIRTAVRSDGNGPDDNSPGPSGVTLPDLTASSWADPGEPRPQFRPP